MTTTKDWGPKLWYSLHIITFNYPDNPTFSDKQNYENFFTSLQYVIPCSLCRQHYRDHLEKNPIKPHLENKISLSKWLVEIHNEVNIMLGKPTLTFEEVVKLYSKTESNYYFKWIISITLLLISLFLIYKYCIKSSKKIYRY